MKTSIGLFKHMDSKLIKTFTVDNGSEFAQFKRLEKATQSRVYFADPHSPWQRGANTSIAAISSATSGQQWKGAIVYSGLLSTGSGVPVSKCHILTNEHVIRGNRHAMAVIEGEQHEGEVTALNKKNDIALIKLSECPIKQYATIAKTPPISGENLTSTYSKSGFNFFNKMSKSKGVFKGFSKTLTEEGRFVPSMVIDDPYPRIGASGGGVTSKQGLVSVIFAIASPFTKQETYGVDYNALRIFLDENITEIGN